MNGIQIAKLLKNECISAKRQEGKKAKRQEGKDKDVSGKK